MHTFFAFILIFLASSLSGCGEIPHTPHKNRPNPWPNLPHDSQDVAGIAQLPHSPQFVEIPRESFVQVIRNLDPSLNEMETKIWLQNLRETKAQLEKHARSTNPKFKSALKDNSQLEQTINQLDLLLGCLGKKIALNDCLLRHFSGVLLPGKKTWGDVLTTGYYLPLIKASKNLKAPYTRPLYKLPESEKLRLHSRHEIDVAGVLRKKNLELAYVRPIDAYVLHLQGSGILEFEESARIFLAHAGNNGRDYVSLGKLLQEKKSLETMSWPWLEDYFSSLPEKELNEFLALNPRYIFFQEKKFDGGPPTTLGTKATAHKTIAVDVNTVPLGSVGIICNYLNEEKLNSNDNAQNGLCQLVIAQDTGGGIKTSGRIDMYLGEGKKAQQEAGILRRQQFMLWLLPKSLEKISP